MAAEDAAVQFGSLKTTSALCARSRSFSAKSFRKRVQNQRVRATGEPTDHFLAGLGWRQLRAAVAADERLIFFRKQQNLDFESGVANANAIAIQTQLAFRQENR